MRGVHESLDTKSPRPSFDSDRKWVHEEAWSTQRVIQPPG